MKAIVDALNIIYDEDEKRGLIWLNVVSLFFTICAIAPQAEGHTLPPFIGTVLCITANFGRR